jgi:broad specificity phosphatase PhoE
VDHNGGSNVVVVCHAATAAALVSHCLSLGPEGLPLMRWVQTHLAGGGGTEGRVCVFFGGGACSHSSSACQPLPDTRA